MPVNTGTQVLTIALAELIPDPLQPRKTSLDEEIQRLAASIGARGVLQPLRVMWDEQRQVWVILTGEGRYRAAKRAGLQSVPCLQRRRRVPHGIAKPTIRLFQKGAFPCL